MSLSDPLTLESLPFGRPARVCAIAGLDQSVADRLVELGFEEGAQVETLHRAPLGGDPLAVRVDGTMVALRRSLARAVKLSDA